jgi:uncharacterized protein (TIGR04222 family)
MWLGPFDLNGSQFLMLYLILLGVAALVSFVIPMRTRPLGRDQVVTDPDYIAYLAGGATRVCESAVARLVAVGGMMHSADGQFFLVSRDVAQSDVEAKILTTKMPAYWSDFLPQLEKPIRQVELKMIGAGLLMTEAQLQQARRWQTLPFAAVFAFGFVKLCIGVARDRPIAILVALLLVTAVVGVMRFRRIDPRTTAGLRALDAAKAQSLRLCIAPMAPEMGMAVAMFGMPVLMGSPFESLHLRLNGAQSSGSDGGFWSGDSGGDGGDGGGCGGCGGCGS